MKTFFFFLKSTCDCVLGLEHSCPWPRECLSSERRSLALASDFFCVLGLGLGLEPCVLDSTSAKDYLNILSSNAAFPLITKPTRITSTSLTLLDHIITNITQNTLLPGILRSDLSDHFPTFCFILLDSKPFKITVNKKNSILEQIQTRRLCSRACLEVGSVFFPFTRGFVN